MPFSSLNETGLHYERSGAGEALVLVSYIVALEEFAAGVVHG
jgi:hypothetical protein